MEAFPRHVLRYGRPDPAAGPLIVRAGPVTALLDGADLRHVRAGDVELVQRVYVAVRDAPWNTIPATLSDLALELAEDRFLVRFRASHRHEDIAFDWDGLISGDPDGTIHYGMDGRCLGTFKYSKIGFNVHHAQEDAVGHAFRARTAGGELRGVLPEDIDPQRIVGGTLSGMFDPYSELAIEVRPGFEAVVSLEGDLLELQDHRNWTDANLKSYGTPLALGFPFDSEDGQRIRQQLTISFHGDVPAPGWARGPEIVVGAIATGGAADRASGGPGGGPAPTHGLPLIGLGAPSHERPLSEREAAWLRVLRPAHLRVDVRPTDEASLAAFDRFVGEAARLDTALELAVHTNESAEGALAAFAQRLARSGARVARVLVYPAATSFSAFVSTTPAAIVALCRRHLEPVSGPVAFCGGTNQSFADINRDRPADAAFGGICFSVSPTVHAADDWSIVENIQAQADVVRMARGFAAALGSDRPVCVSPVTIATRFGPYPAGPAREGDLPPAVDVRQVSLLVAAWTVGSLARLAEAGAASVTYYETTGWRGVIETDDGSPMPERFPSRPGMAFPVFHVLADAAEWSSGMVLPVAATDPLRAVALAVSTDAMTHVVVGNVTPEAQRVLLRGLPDGTARVRVLDEASAETALVDPSAWRAAPGAPAIVQDGRIWLELGPFAVARVDAQA